MVSPTSPRAPRSARFHAFLSAEQRRRLEFSELFRSHHRQFVRTMVARLRCSRAVAEDACGHAWLQLWRRAPTDENSNLWAWLYVVALHEGWRLLRRQSRELAAVARDDEGRETPLVELVADRRDPELALEAKRALEALAALRPRQRETLALQVAGYSYREIQAIRGVTYTNVNRHVTEGRAATRRLRDTTPVHRRER